MARGSESGAARSDSELANPSWSWQLPGWGCQSGPFFGAGSCQSRLQSELPDWRSGAASPDFPVWSRQLPDWTWQLAVWSCQCELFRLTAASLSRKRRSRKLSRHIRKLGRRLRKLGNRQASDSKNRSGKLERRTGAQLGNGNSRKQLLHRRISLPTNWAPSRFQKTVKHVTQVPCMTRQQLNSKLNWKVAVADWSATWKCT